MLDLPLDAPEVRVLGCLIEKDLSTPDYYPMTVNALVQACNQKTNRDPVVAYDEADVAAALETLQRRRLAGIAGGAGSRVDKYRHALAEALGLTPAEQAVLASLMLRGPQTVGEIRGRTGRMHDFDALETVEATLHALSTREPALAAELERLPGQKETRFAHLLAGTPVVEAPPVTRTETDRLAQLEDEVSRLRDDLDALRDAFAAFRAQLE